MTFKEAYKFPLKWDDGYVWTDDHNMAFQFMNKVLSENAVNLYPDTQKDIVNKINGECSEFYSSLSLDYDKNNCMIKWGGGDLILIRGYGHLTGSGGLQLSEGEACQIQDEFARFIIDQLK